MNDIADDCMDAGGTTPRMGKIESRLEQRSAVTELIPHTGDMVLLERIIDYDEQGLTAELVVRGDGLFGDDQTVPAWAGIEYMAQAIAAYVGVKARQANEPIRMGFLLGTRRYNSNVAAFKVGATLTIRVNKIMQDDGLGVFDCRIQGEGVDVAANLNVYRPPLNNT
ncbi:hotdog family protein [Methylobacter tundripaludum]|uniref:ApeP family dehydratase n=1 Tax=Methylobacter tundripaludum TaxID=173365 RepID=UPI0009DF7580|nr:hotdog family protein [Methylobacter tundripaludum]